MNGVIESDKVGMIHHLYTEDEVARRFLDAAAARVNDATETKVERAATIARVSESEIRRVFREFQRMGLGALIQGRKGHKTRFVWDYSLRSIGRAATNQAKSLENIDVNQIEA